MATLRRKVTVGDANVTATDKATGVDWQPDQLVFFREKIKELSTSERLLLATQIVDDVREETMTTAQAEDIATISEAADICGLKRRRVERWVQCGRLDVAERRPGPHEGIILVKLSDVLKLRDNPPPNGRPRKG